jgi:hypothetical protein
MFPRVFPSIIRSPKVYIQSQVYVIQVCWLLASGPASKQSTNLYDIYLTLYVQSRTPDDGQKDHPKHVEWYSINSKYCASSWFYHRKKWIHSYKGVISSISLKLRNNHWPRFQQVIPAELLVVPQTAGSLHKLKWWLLGNAQPVTN